MCNKLKMIKMKKKKKKMMMKMKKILIESVLGVLCDKFPLRPTGKNRK